MPEPTVDTLGSNQVEMLSRLAPINALLGGTIALREAGEEFLPRYDQESSRVYESRRKRAVCFNYFGESSAAMAGRPFRTPVKVHNPSEALKELLSDIDMLGQSLTTCAHGAFRLGLRKGFCGILVDFPSVTGATNLAEERAQGARPYLKVLSPESFVAGYATSESGKEVIQHVRIFEQCVEREGFTEVVVDRIRILELDEETGYVTWQLWEKSRPGDRRRKEIWELHTAPTPTTLTEIPLVVFYAGEREDFLLARPPLEDLAHLNIQHWQSYSDQIHVLTVARFPILAFTGVDDEDKTEIGPNKCIRLRLERAKAFYVEHTGAAIGAGRQDLMDLETRMAALGVDLLIRPSGRATATGKSIDEAQSGSALQALAMDFQDAVTTALRLMEKWLGTPDPEVTVEVNADFGLTLKDQADLQFLSQLRVGGDISRKSILAEAKRRNILPETFNSNANDEELEEEQGEIAMEMKGLGDPPMGDAEDEEDTEDDIEEETV